METHNTGFSFQYNTMRKTLYPKAQKFHLVLLNKRWEWFIL